MYPNVQLSIPEPCHQDWHTMTPLQQGRFCSACAKEVIDFTAMTDQQVLYYFLDKRNEKVCGRMYPDQLNRSITKTVYPVKKKRWYWHLAALLLLLTKPAAAKAQGMIKAMPATQQKEDSGRAALKVSGNSIPGVPKLKNISGTVMDEDGMPVSFAMITVKGTDRSVSADENGSFLLKAAVSKDVLRVSAVGYEDKELVLLNTRDYTIVLKKKEAATEETVVIAGGVWGQYEDAPAAALNYKVVIEVLDNASHLPVKATIAVVKNGSVKTDTVTTDAKGMYKLKRIKAGDAFSLTVKAEGYLETVLQVKGWSMQEPKETRYVFLEKAPVFSDFKKLEEVRVTNAAVCILRRQTTGLVVSAVTQKRTLADSLAQLTARLSGTMQIAPNPVPKGAAVTLQYKVKQAGVYFIQITNAAGQQLLQQQVTAGSKNNTIQILTNAAWSSGVYYLRLTGATSQLISTKRFMLQ